MPPRSCLVAEVGPLPGLRSLTYSKDENGPKVYLDAASHRSYTAPVGIPAMGDRPIQPSPTSLCLPFLPYSRTFLNRRTNELSLVIVHRTCRRGGMLRIAASAEKQHFSNEEGTNVSHGTFGGSGTWVDNTVTSEVAHKRLEVMTKLVKKKQRSQWKKIFQLTKGISLKVVNQTF